jgi:hypothetical protein
MDTQTLDHRIDTLLNDPLVSLMIRADSVDRAMLACQMRRLGRPVDERQVRDEACTGAAL